MASCNNCPSGGGTCGIPLQLPIWPSNTGNELLYATQRLFSRDDHNHTEVLGERYYGLPFLVPENQRRPPAKYVDASTGEVREAPFSSDNVMHTDWVPYRLNHNTSTPFGSDSDIFYRGALPGGGSKFYEGTPAQNGHTQWKDWLDRPLRLARQPVDDRVRATCDERGGQVCSHTCVDWWTNRPVPPQGSMSSNAVGGGCPFGTLDALACYPCNVHESYQRGSK